jgi:PTS system mannose-specific IIA component
MKPARDVPATGAVVVTHGGVGRALLEAAEQIVGPLAGVAVVGVRPGEPPEPLAARIEAAAAEVDGGAGVLVLGDLLGSTPANICSRLLEGARPMALLCGVNLAMLLKLSTIDRSLGPAALAGQLRDTGLRAIRVTTRTGDLP